MSSERFSTSRSEAGSESGFQLQAGGAYLGSGSDHPARFHYLTVDWNDDAVRLDFRKYAGEKRIWVLDGDTGEDGVKSFTNTGLIRRTERKGGGGESNRAPSPLPALPSEYLKWNRENCAYMDVDNLQGKGGPISVSLPDIFIPLYAMEPSGGMSGMDSAASRRQPFRGCRPGNGIRKPDGNDLEGRPSLPDMEGGSEPPKGRRFDVEELIGRHEDLILEGHPGSGKTTLLKHLSYCLKFLQLTFYRTINVALQHPAVRLRY